MKCAVIVLSFFFSVPVSARLATSADLLLSDFADTEVTTNLVACDVQPMGSRRLRVVFTTGRAGAVRAASAQLCAPGVTNELFAAPFAWPYDPHWNRVRLTARGFDEPSASFCSQTTPDGSTITLR